MRNVYRWMLSKIRGRDTEHYNEMLDIMARELLLILCPCMCMYALKKNICHEFNFVILNLLSCDGNNGRLTSALST